jgi:hypothetical protein
MPDLLIEQGWEGKLSDQAQSKRKCGHQENVGKIAATGMTSMKEEVSKSKWPDGFRTNMCSATFD